MGFAELRSFSYLRISHGLCCFSVLLSRIGPIKVFRFAIQDRRTRHQTGPDTPTGPRDVALRWRATALRAARAAILWRASITDDGKDSVHAFTQALPHRGVTTAPVAAARTAAQRRARVPPRRRQMGRGGAGRGERAPFRAGSHAWRRHRNADCATALRHNSGVANRSFSPCPAIVPEKLVCRTVGGHPEHGRDSPVGAEGPSLARTSERYGALS